MPLKVNIHHLERGEVTLRGEIPENELDLELPDELVHVRQPVKYNLTAQNTGSDILVQGRFEAVLDCECSRCLKKFQQTVQVPGWTVLVPLEGEEKAEIKDDSVDLTPYLREDILLELPQQPLCEADCAGLLNRSEKNAKQKNGVGQAAESPVWSELNKLKFLKE
jgi:uncharacterized protein